MSFLILAGCGGGGGGVSNSPPANPPINPPSARSFTIGGSVGNLAAGRSLTLQNNGGDNLVLSANGSFSFGAQVAEGAVYAVTVAAQPQGQNCIVERERGTALAAVSDVAVVCSDVLAATYRVGGTVSGLPGNGSVLVLRNNALDFLDVAVNGSFRFNAPLAAGAAYAVVVQAVPAGQQCTVNNGVGSATSDVLNVEVLCSAASAAPPGGVQSMVGTWLNGVCTAAAAGQSTRRMLRVTRQTGMSAAISEATVSYANTRCDGSIAGLGAFAPASLATVRRTETTASTTASWTHWQPAVGVINSTLWHWRRNELCLRVGSIGDSTDPEVALPTAAAVEAAFAAVPATAVECFTRQ